MAKKSYIPQGYSAVIPALAFKGAAAAIDWYSSIFGARVKMRMDNPDKTIGHAEIVIGDSLVFLADENPKFNTSPKTLKGNSVNLCVYVENVDEVVKKAVAKGAKEVLPVTDQFYGDRSGRIEDPFGYVWLVATHIRDVSEEEMHRKMEEMAHN